MSDLDKKFWALAGLGAVQGIKNSQDMAANKVARAIEGLKEKVSPLKKRYQLLAANGCDLLAHCDNCNQDMRFLPEYAGEETECIRCKKPLILCRVEDFSFCQCQKCNSKIKFLGGGGSPILCARCEPNYYQNNCPHCREYLIVSKSLGSNFVCPHCQGKIKATDAGISLNGKNNIYFFEKRGFFG
jgi:hypothetical protein